MSNKSAFDRLIDYSCDHEWVFWIAEAVPVVLVCGLAGYLFAKFG